jgi:hypothetical protein
MILKDTTVLPYQSLQQLWSLATNLKADQGNAKTYTYIYWGELDTLSHQVGPQDPQLAGKWNDFAVGLARFIHACRNPASSDTLLILTADHGQIPTEILADYELRSHPGLISHLIMSPSGEGRLPFLFIKPGHAGAIADYLASHWDSRFQLLPSEKVLASGLLGNAEPYQGTIERLGQYVVFPKGNAYWWWVNKENRLRGRHGGLSRQEMLVPFFAMEI